MLLVGLLLENVPNITVKWIQIRKTTKPHVGAGYENYQSPILRSCKTYEKELNPVGIHRAITSNHHLATTFNSSIQVVAGVLTLKSCRKK